MFFVQLMRNIKRYPGLKLSGLSAAVRLLALCLLLSVFAGTEVVAQRKRVGVVLSGGGAKGVAHIGVLKVLEEAGIPVDYVVGTSMGAIVGGLYAIGYDARSLDSLVRNQDWTYLLSDEIYRRDLSFQEREAEERYILTLPFDRLKARRPIGFVSGQNVYTLFTDLTVGYHGQLDFSRLPIPFACIGADLYTKKEVVLDQGNLPLAMRASMAIPGFFTPVKVDSLLLVDGGVVNNFPADVVRAMGADVVIGVDVQAELMGEEELGSVTHVLPQLVNLLCMNKYRDNLRLADVVIRPDINAYSAASFNARAIDSLLFRGELAAREKLEALLDLKRQLGVTEESVVYAAPVREKEVSRFFVSRLRFEGLSRQQEEWVRRLIRIDAGEEISLADLRRTINTLYATRTFSAVNYRLTGGPEYELLFELTPHPMNYFHIGFRFDSDEMAAILLNTTFSNRLIRGSRVSFTGRLGKSPYLRMDFSLEKTFLRGFNLSGEFRFNDTYLYRKGERSHNITYRYYLSELGGSFLRFRNLAIQTGLRYEFFDYNSFLYADGASLADIRPEGFISYFASVRFETIERNYFPESGFMLRGDYSLYTDNFLTYKDGVPFSALAFQCRGVVPLSNRLKLLPAFYGRVLTGGDPAFAYYNCMGGLVPGRQLSQQLPFWGIPHAELFDHTLMVGQLRLRQRVGGRHYFSAVGNVALQAGDPAHLFDRSPIWGGGFAYSRYSRVGPVDLVLTASDWVSGLRFYFNLGFYF